VPTAKGVQEPESEGGTYDDNGENNYEDGRQFVCYFYVWIDWCEKAKRLLRNPDLDMRGRQRPPRTGCYFLSWRSSPPSIRGTEASHQVMSAGPVQRLVLVAKMDVDLPYLREERWNDEGGRRHPNGITVDGTLNVDCVHKLEF
jgi:hypothetical protein